MLVRAAPEGLIPLPNGPEDYGHYERLAPAPLPKIRTVTASSFASRPVPERSWLVPNLIPDRTVTMLSGDGGVGKSLLALQLGVACATASSWIGTMPSPGGVVYASAEDEEDEVHRRLAQICDAKGIDLERLADLHIIPLADEDAVMAGPLARTDSVAPTPLYKAVEVKVAELRPRLLVIDNLADAFGGNENSRPQARQFVGLFRALAIRHRLAVLLISHPSLTGISSGSGTSGSTAWSNSVRSRLYLDRQMAKDGSEVDPDLRVLRTMKANYSAMGVETTIRWQEGYFRVAGDTSHTFDRLVAEKRTEEIFLKLLADLALQGRDVSPNVSNTYAPTVFAKQPEAGGIAKRAFERAMNSLFQSGKIKVEKFGPPSKQRTRIVAA